MPLDPAFLLIFLIFYVSLIVGRKSLPPVSSLPEAFEAGSQEEQQVVEPLPLWGWLSWGAGPGKVRALWFPGATFSPLALHQPPES